MIRSGRVLRVDAAGRVWVRFPSGQVEGPYPAMGPVTAGAQVAVAELDPPSGAHLVLGAYPTGGAP